jgi:hypothetical protein
VRGLVADPNWKETFDRAAALATLRERWGGNVEVHRSYAQKRYVVHNGQVFLAAGSTSEEAVLEALAVPAPPREVDP